MKYLCEYLPRIGIISVVLEGVYSVKVESVAERELTLQVVDEGTEDAHMTKIELPDKAIYNESVSQFKKGSQAEFVLRLNAKAADYTDKYDALIASSVEKWSKKDLLQYSGFSLRCKKCKHPVIDNSNCKKLNEMPSEFWMEFMDYWHCHKPTINDDKGNGVLLGKYNSLAPLKYEILVGGSYFLGVAETFQDRVEYDSDNLVCATCHNNLGQVTFEKLLRLHKWELLLETSDTSESFAPSNDILLSLLNQVSGTSGRHVLLRCKDVQLLVWTFAIDVGATLTDGKVLINAMKLLYTDDDDEIEIVRRRQNIDEIQTLPVPFYSFMNELRSSTELLPSICRRMNFWEVGYLQLSSGIEFL
ncbi:hypothetical protein KAFR_0E04440 [Kazachstania africana CBS 2517]|uniref:Ubiquitin-conjugating enzyme E2C-binding protein n=1 Tax=Kazachstania africana (strain ATCC 22294 / BCRC 22015 / CBS 2517 / CECT 1963 / NBRC 1671 / NRRL Y-8276) TaxID=1071382 RepID=H2AW44_KAZAF|nr:hypothetical protein KAFR_0E04440 [Kazachstania africana CBS 2517]CCF58594.1 hypothetical protein KAFR_0E04440 [Kazachstania africana CBS 2517]